MDEQERIEQQTSEEAVNNEPMTLDEALAAARAEVEARGGKISEADLFHGDFGRAETPQSAEEAPVQEEATSEEVPTEEAPVQTEEVVPEQVGTGELYALRQQIAQQNAAMQAMQAQLMQAQQAMQGMQQQVQETNNVAAQEVVSEMMTPPTFDVASIMYASEEEQRAASQRFVDDTMKYTRQEIMKELQPVLNDFNAREADVQRRNVKDVYRNNAQYAGFQDREAWMEQILDKNPELKGLPLNKQYEIAYLITQGVDAVKARDNPPPAPAPKTIDLRIADAEGDEELMRALEERRVRNIAQSQKELPPNLVAGGGTSRVGLNVPDEPTDFDMAREGAFNFLRGRK